MSIAPIVRSVTVKQPQARAFEIFASEIGRWWPLGKTIGKNPHVAVVIEPRAEGRWFERDAEGHETLWGKVLAFEPPSRLLLGWQLDSRWTYDSDFLTEVELTFIAIDANHTRVTLEHRDLERYGADAEKYAGLIGEGWPKMLSEFESYANTKGKTKGDSKMSTFTLHSIPGSPFGRSALALLMEKGATHRFVSVPPGSLKSEQHLALHAFGRVPVLEHDGFILYETQAILRYLDRVLPTPAFTPADPRAAARMDQIMGVSDWYLFQGVANVIGFQRIVGPKLLGLPTDEAAIAAAMPKAHVVFSELARLLGAQSYMAGDAVSLADFMVAPQIDFFAGLPEWEPLMGPHANLQDWHQRMNARPSMLATTWEKVAQMAAA